MSNYVQWYGTLSQFGNGAQVTVVMDGTSTELDYDTLATCLRVPGGRVMPVSVATCYFDGVAVAGANVSLSGTVVKVTFATAPSAGTHAFQVTLNFPTA